MRDQRQGCLAGLFQLFFLNQVFDWLQSRFGFGRGCSCTGCGCGVLLFIIGTGLTCSILAGTDWGRLFSLAAGLAAF